MIPVGDASFFFEAFLALFTIINPVSCASLFLAITKGASHIERTKTAARAAITATIVLFIFAFGGQYILHFFGITIEAFKIAGGIIIGTIGFKMVLFGREHFFTPEEKDEAVEKEDVSLIPLAIPMLSGPGAITTTMVLTSSSQSLVQFLLILLAILTCTFLSYFILAKSELIEQRIGKNGQRVTERIIGLIVLVVGVQLIINGITALV